MSTHPSSESLAGLSLFRGLTADELQMIAACVGERSLARAETLFDLGAASDGAYILREGMLVAEMPLAYGGTVELARLGPGTVVGEPSLVAQGPRCLRVRALKPSQLWFVDGVAFSALRATRSTAAFKVVRNVCVTACDRLRSTNQFIECELRGERWSAVTESVAARTGVAEAARRYFGGLFGRGR